MKLFLVSVLFAVVYAACNNTAPKNANAKKTLSNTVVDAQANSFAHSGNAVLKTGSTTGVVTKINLEIGSVELKHDEIKGMMPAMQMEFYVSDKKEMESLKVGDKVLFTLEDNHGAEKITKISKVE